jgi:hypothetical protein
MREAIQQAEIGWCLWPLQTWLRSLRFGCRTAAAAGSCHSWYSKWALDTPDVGEQPIVTNHPRGRLSRDISSGARERTVRVHANARFQREI